MTQRNNPYEENPLLGRRPNQPLTPEALHERFIALCKHHGISDPEHDPEAMAKIAYRLAKTHVPGFQPKRPAGRPKERTPFELAVFLVDFIHTQIESGIAPVQTALKQMSKDPWWVQDGFDNTKKDVLQAMRHEMQELRKPGAFEQVISEINTMSVSFFEWLKKNPEEQRSMRDKLGEDFPAWRKIEGLLRD